MPNFKKFKAYQKDIDSNISPVMLSGLTDAGKVQLASATQFYSKRPIFIVTYNEMQAKKLIKDFSFYTDKVAYFPKREIATYDIIAESKDVLYERMDTINGIEQGKFEVVVTTIEAACQKMIRKESLYQNRIELKTGSSCSLEETRRKLQYLGYERVELVEAKGQYSSRGGILDIGISDKQGVRIEFWGDDIDSIRYFSFSNQRSDHMTEEVIIYPCHEFVLEKSLEKVKEQILTRTFSDKAKEYLKQDLEQIEQGDYTSKVDKYFNCFYEKQETILDYLEQDVILFYDEIGKIKARIENIKKDNENMIKSLVEKERFVPQSIQNVNDFVAFSENNKNKQIVYLEKQDIGFIDKESIHAKKNGYSFSYREVNYFRSSMDLLFEEVQAAKIDNKTIIILGGSKENSKKISSLLLEKGITNEYSEEKDDIAAGDIIVTPGAISAGFECYDFDLLVITGSELFTKPQRKRVVNKAFKEGETIIFADLKIGDFIVHKTNGIGQFIGVNTIKADGVTKDYIKIRYKGDDVLYVPTNNLDNVRKYIGAGESVAPRLSKLGSKEWEKTKAKVKSNLEVIAKQLVELYAKRQKVKGFAFSKDTPWQKEFEDQFPYQETEDQLRCIEEVKKDMEMAKPMDRLLCGDVGYGKTEVAIRAAFKACMDQKQVAYLVPTTILSTQQYESFKERMEAFPIRVEVLNRFRTPKEQKEIIKKLELGEIDVIIGTHRILSQDIKFKDLGLLIIDEEHRFGVKAKEKIKELKTNVDVLTMTATPIPRTLHMSIVGVRDMSVIYEPPQNRRPVQTYVLEYDEEVMKEAITKELERDGQVFYLYNKVESIIQKAEQISKLVPEAKVAFAHGKMTGKELEEIMLEFIEKKINVLVCTTILESGIDIPNANTIIVENADRLGLAQLYQIRGRVRKSR